MTVDKLKEEYEKLSIEFSQLNTQVNQATANGGHDDKLELALMRKQRELNEKYQALVQAQIKEGDK